MSASDVALSHGPIDVSATLADVRSNRAGAVVLFLGTTREFTEGKQTQMLEYEGYEPMAREQMQRLTEEARNRWNLCEARIVHRLGEVALGEVSVAVAVSAAHRAAAFEAGQWLIDRLKEQVPIWKKECWADGTTEWVHPADGRPPIP